MRDFNGDPIGIWEPSQRRQPHTSSVEPPSQLSFVRPWLIAALLVLLLLAVRAALAIWLNQTWFTAVGFGDVYATRLQAAYGVGAVVGLGCGGLFAIFWGLALWRVRRQNLARYFAAGSPFRLLPSVPGWLLLSAIVGIIFGLAASGNGAAILVWLQRPSFGQLDPIFGQDISFYLFVLPLLQWLHGLLTGVLLLTLATVALLAVGVEAAAASERGEQTGPSWRLQANPLLPLLSVLAGLFLLVLAANAWFDTFGLVYSPRGVVFGTSATDIAAQVPANIVVGVLTALAGLGLLANAVRPRLWPFAAAAVVYVAANFLIGLVFPNLYEGLVVHPDQLARETPYIQNNIAMTRQAFNLESVPLQDLSGTANLDHAALAANQGALADVRIWDWRPLAETYRQLQRLQQYYEFDDVDVDRYPLAGGTRQVMLSVRELDFATLPQVAQTWQNKHLVYTHGYGAVMNTTSDVGPQGLPDFLLRDIPPQASDPALQLAQPQIYYGSLTTSYAIVRTHVAEFDHPGEDASTEVTTTYQGSDGIPVGSGVRRAALATAVGDLNLYLSNAVDGESELLLHRTLTDRIHLLAPFLRLDADPYPVVLNGRILWVQDAYTTSDRYPDATRYPDGGYNYIRNSVKITVDAATGETRFYVMDPHDPLLAAFRAVYPSLFTPLDQAPADLVAHFRYPEDLFTAQASMLATYHMTDPRTFFNREDLWSIARETFGDHVQQMPAFYVTIRLPGETQEEFALILPFTPAGGTRQNMVAWMVARADPAHYGEVEVYRFPAGQQVYGPQQIEARINQNPQIASALALWNRQGSTVVRGNLLVIPLGQSLLYLQPLYLQAQQNPLPQLERIIVASSDGVVMSDTLQTALEALAAGKSGEVLSQSAPATSATAATAPATGPGQVAAAPTPAAGAETPAQQALRAYDEAQQALKNGDWATYGDRMRTVQQLLQQMAGQS